MLCIEMPSLARQLTSRQKTAAQAILKYVGGRSRLQQRARRDRLDWLSEQLQCSPLRRHTLITRPLASVTISDLSCQHAGSGALRAKGTSEDVDERAHCVVM
jgi:hypothetical protein